MDPDPGREAIGQVPNSEIKTAEYSIDGVPVSQVRHSISVRNGKPRAFYKSKTFRRGKINALNNITVQHYKKGFRFIPAKVPVKVKLTYVFPRPQLLKTKKSEPGFIPHTVKPDIDNLDKLYLDCLSGIAFNDDNQICRIESTKVFAAYNFSTKTEGWTGVFIQVFSLNKSELRDAVDKYLPF